MTAPRVTVLMSVHNGGPWLRAAIDKVLAQTWRDFEFVIVDDASTDDSAAQIAGVRDPRIRLIRLPENIGLTRSLNLGLREARGEFVARQDADDFSMAQRLALQVAFLTAHPEVAVVGAQGRTIDGRGRSRGPRNLPREAASVRWLSLFDNPVIHSAAMFRTALVREEYGGYDESFPTCQDYDLWARIMARHPICNLPERLVVVREHASSISATRRAEGEKMVRRVVAGIQQQSGLDESAVDVAVAYRRHLSAAELPLLESTLSAWNAHFPDPSADLRRTRAQVLGRVGYNLLNKNRLRAMEQIYAALREFPPLAAELPWLRMAALFLLGEQARKLGGR